MLRITQFFSMYTKICSYCKLVSPSHYISFYVNQVFHLKNCVSLTRYK